MRYEYKVIPAPTKGEKARGAKTGADRFARAFETAMNRLGAEGWHYLRTDTLPVEERQGLTGRTTVYRNVMVFARPLDADTSSDAAAQPTARPLAIPAPVPGLAATDSRAEPPLTTTPADTEEAHVTDTAEAPAPADATTVPDDDQPAEAEHGDTPADTDQAQT